MPPPRRLTGSLCTYCLAMGPMGLKNTDFGIPMDGPRVGELFGSRASPHDDLFPPGLSGRRCANFLEVDCHLQNVEKSNRQGPNAQGL